VARVTQLLELAGSEDWTGYEQVGALPIQLFGMDFTRMAMYVPSPVLEQVTVGGVSATEEVEAEEIVASGGPTGQMLPPGRSLGKRSVTCHTSSAKWPGSGRASHSPKWGSCVYTEHDWGT
jgi:hypothetical protein